LKQSSLFDNQKHLCQWVPIHQNSEEEQTYVCKYHHQAVSWQATILISVVVTLLSSLGILLIDYLFIDILSAPTAESIHTTTQGSTSIRSQLSRQFLTEKTEEGKGEGERKAGDVKQQSTSTRLTRAKSSLKDSLLADVTEVRILPPELIEAHADAVSSFGLSLGESQEREMKNKLEHRQSQRVSRLTQFKRQTSQSGGGGGGATNELRQPSLTQKRKENEKSDKDELSSDELLTALLMEMKEERGKLKRETERQAFDTLWG
jgi:hypothetical protein